MGKLDNTLSYMIGPIENANDQGVGWRNELKTKCFEAGLKIKWLDPCHKITSLKEEIGAEHTRTIQLAEEGRYDELSTMMYTIVRQDHRQQDLCDFVVIYIDKNVHMCGSYFEFQAALTQKKPYFVICPQGKSKIPKWLFGVAKHINFYSSIDAVVDKLYQLDTGKEELSDRWVLIRNELENL